LTIQSFPLEDEKVFIDFTRKFSSEKNFITCINKTPSSASLCVTAYDLNHVDVK